VAGRSPLSNLSLDDWLHASPPADIYVLGYDLVVIIFTFPVTKSCDCPLVMETSLLIFVYQISRDSSFECW